MKFKKRTWALFILFDVVAVIQFIPVDRTNPPVTNTIDVPKEVMAIFKRSCFDCHSNETNWPWYSYVAPMSWLVSKDVHDGRRHLNFSEWDTYNSKQKNHRIEEVGEMVEEGEMPLWFYVPLHPEAELSESDIELIETWSKNNS